MFFIKIDKSIPMFGLSIIKDLELCGTINALTGQPEIYIEYKKAKFMVHADEDEIGTVIMDQRNGMKGFANGDATGISLYIENKYYNEAIELLDLLKSYSIRAFMVLLDDTKVSLDRI